MRNKLEEEAAEKESEAYNRGLDKANVVTSGTRSFLDLQYLFSEGTASSV